MYGLNISVVGIEQSYHVISFIPSTTTFTFKKIRTSNYHVQVLVSDFTTDALSKSLKVLKKIWMEKSPNIFTTYSHFLIMIKNNHHCDNYHTVFLILFVFERYQVEHRSDLA